MPKLSTSRAPRVTMFPAEAPPRRFSKRAWLGFVALSFAAGGLGMLLSGPDVPGYYQSLATPPLAPPSSVFGPVWSVLYVLMGTSAALVWKFRDQPAGRRALTLWGVQLALNSLWSGLFFGLRAPGVALVEIALLWGAIAAYAASAYALDRRAAWLVAPYLAWVSFATYLNAGIWWLNR